VIEWVDESWTHEVGEVAAQQTNPVSALLAVARGHAVLETTVPLTVSFRYVRHLRV
jgi:hypothetical protein